jgi:hypothetical protein
VKSVSNETVSTTATVSSNGSEGEGGSGGTLDAVVNLISGIVTKLINSVTGLSTSAEVKLNTVSKTVEGAGYTVTLAETEHGSVSAVSKADEGEAVAVRITPNPGYKVSQLHTFYKYLPEGSDAYRTVGITGTESGYSFTMPPITSPLL